jgi:hypothetical protein
MALFDAANQPMPGPDLLTPAEILGHKTMSMVTPLFCSTGPRKRPSSCWTASVLGLNFM